MAVTKKFTEQIVVMTTPEQAVETRGIADEFGVSVAQAARDAMALGLPSLREKYQAAGVVKPTVSIDDKALAVIREAAQRAPKGGVGAARAREAARNARKSTKSKTSKAPAAVFSAPAAQ